MSVNACSYKNELVLQRSNMIWRLCPPHPRRRRRKSVSCLRSVEWRNPHTAPVSQHPASHALASALTRKICWPRWALTASKTPYQKTKITMLTWTLSAVIITKYNAVLNCVQLPFAGVRGLWQMGCGYFQNIWVFWQSSPNGSDVHNLPGIKCGIKNFSHVVSVKALQ